MKKFISMVMAAAMVVSLVPATAFAANDATFKVVGDKEYTEEVAEDMVKADTAIVGPEVQIKIVDVDQKETTDGNEGTWEITLDFDGAEFDNAADDGVVFAEGQNISGLVEVEGQSLTGKEAVFVVDEVEDEDTSITIEISKDKVKLAEDMIINIDIEGLGLILADDKAGHEATVTVSGDFGDSDAMVFAAVLEEGVTVTLKKVAEVAVEEDTPLERKLTIEADVDKFCDDQVFELILSKGFEFEELKPATGVYQVLDIDENEAVIALVDSVAKFDIAAEDMVIEAVDAEAGDVCTITVKAKGSYDLNGTTYGDCDDCIKATAEAVEAVKVVADSITMSVDEDEDVPVMYSGVNLEEVGLTSQEDHTSLEVTIEESVAEAWDLKKGFTLSLPDGVYVAGAEGVDVITMDNIVAKVPASQDKEDAIVAEFAEAYNDGEYKAFDFGRKTFVAEDEEKTIELSFTLELVADAGFVGDVVLTLEYDGETQEVVIAEFVTPMVVEASANDVIIDYRNTKVPTTIVVKEAEAGLWDDGLKVGFSVEDPASSIRFEDDMTVAVNEESEMEVDDYDGPFGVGFVVDTKSDDEAAVVTVSDIELYMSRNIPAGAYDLVMNYYMTTEEVENDVEGNEYMAEVLFGADDDYKTIYDVTDMDGTVKEGWINVVTAGRDADDASFTTKVVVPVGESYIVAGEQTVALDVPAYVSASGYTMLPVRAVAVALGILNNNVLWDQASKTVTILYGQRIITMTVGAKVINVNGSAIPASSSPEVVDGRTFLPMRDLATALGVTDITWDAATKTATLNGNK